MHTHTHTHTKIHLEKQAISWKFQEGGAFVQCQLWDVLHINYSGGIGIASLHKLDMELQPLRKMAPVALERMDQAFTAVTDAVVCEPAWLPGTPPSAVIVRDDQYLLSLEFCARLSRRGILRLTFLPHQVEHAIRWTQRTRDAWLSRPCTR